jgi:hypothetical protein
MTHSHTYPVPPERLLAVLTDPDYLAARQERFAGVGDPTVESTGDDIAVTLVRQLPMDKIPGAVKGFIGDGRITQVETWSTSPAEDEALLGTWRGEVAAAPADIGGTYRIAPEADGSRYDIDVRVKVKVPLVGGKIEQQVRGYLDHIITKEQGFLADWVAEA